MPDGRPVDWYVADDADEEDEDERLSTAFDDFLLADIAHDVDIARATLDVCIDARDNTDLHSVMLALEGVSYRLTDVNTRLLHLVSGDE